GTSNPGTSNPGTSNPGTSNPGTSDKVENNNISTFVYDDGKSKYNIKYDSNEKRLLIEDAEVVTSKMLDFAAKNIMPLQNGNDKGILLDFPQAKIVSAVSKNINNPLRISKINFPKIEKIDYENYSIDEILKGIWTNHLEGDKVIQNGILFKWMSPIGDINDDKITQIITDAIYDTSQITSINLPNVKTINDYAFAENKKIYSDKIFPKIKKKIVLNNILVKWDDAEGDIKDDIITDIYSSVFKDNDKINSINFPNVVTVKNDAFNNATNLVSISLPSLKKSAPFAFKNTKKLTGKVVAGTTLIKWTDAGGNISDNNITDISAEVFSGNGFITSVDFPNVVNIQQGAFQGAQNLRTINFPNAEYIGESAFEDAYSINSLDFPKVISIGSKAFQGIRSNLSISFPNVVDVKNDAFAHNNFLRGKVVVGSTLIKWTDATGDITDKNITNIADQAFENNDFITSVNFPNVKSIGSNAFAGAKNLQSVNLPKVSDLDNNLFENTPKLTGKIVLGTTLLKWTDASGDINDDSITDIADNVFKDNTQITSVNFPNVKTIGSGAFEGATNLKTVNLPKVVNVGNNIFENTPKLTGKIVLANKLVKWSDASGEISDDSITEIADNVFRGNTKITSVNFPNVTYIGNGVFEGATNLESVSLPKANRNYYYSFKNTPKLTGKVVLGGTLFKWSDASGEISDDSITEIADNVFRGNTKITSVNFPNAAYIGISAFEGATNLESVNLPMVSRFDYNVFKNTPKLTGKIVSGTTLVKWTDASGDINDDSITAITDNVFKDNTQITSVNFPNVKSIGANAFAGAKNLQSVNLPKDVDLGYNVFKNTPKLTGKIVSGTTLLKWSDASGAISDNSITEIAGSAFNNNTQITSVNFPNVTKIGSYAFKGATNLESVNLPKAVDIGYNVFKNTPKLTGKVVLGGTLFKWSDASGTISDDSIAAITDNVFKDNTQITSVNFPNVTYIGNGAFEGATNLESVSLPKLNKNYYYYFENNPKLTGKVVLGGTLFKWSDASGDINDNSITEIANNVFRDNTKITSVNFPNVKSIGSNAFAGAKNLQSVNLPKVSDFDNNLFENTPKLTGKVVLANKLLKWSDASGAISDDSITEIAGSAFNNNTQITSVNFPNVTKIGSYAFEGATNLETVSLPKAFDFEYNIFENTPKLTGKVVLANKLVKWTDASGDINDDSITEIDDNVFRGNTQITSVNFPNVKTIGSGAFEGATNLKSVNLPKVVDFAPNLFDNTPQLTGKVVLGTTLLKWSDASGEISDENVRYITMRVFYNNTQITSVNFPNVESIDIAAFEGATNLKSVNFSKNVDFEDNAFENTPKLTGKIVLGNKLLKWSDASGAISDNSITEIAGSAFNNNTQITSVNFPNVTKIGSYAFEGATNLESVNLPKAVDIGYNIFKNTPKLTGKVVLGGTLFKWSDASGDINDNSITEIDNNVFKDNTQITSVNFPNVTKIGSYAFKGATNLKYVNLPKVVDFKDDVFENNPKLTGKVVLGNKLVKWTDASGAISDDSITVIVDNVFKDNTQITSVNFPNVTYIGRSAFEGAINLSLANFPTLRYVMEDAFENTPKLIRKPNVGYY
ncbi:leucine-rich repeat protein, partial [Mycoplasma sp. 2634B]|uniref:leucine-rich repeat domain-containing protein n=1 Tax=Mycoplasma sp. 2634B TaxID=3401692 RepID=UPI003AB0FD3C